MRKVSPGGTIPVDAPKSLRTNEAKLSTSDPAPLGWSRSFSGRRVFRSMGLSRPYECPPYFYTFVHALSLIVPALFALGMAALYASGVRCTAWPVKVGIFLSLIASVLGLAQGLFSVPATSKYMYYALWWYPAILPPSVWIAVLPTGLLLAGVGTIGERDRRKQCTLLIAMGTCGLSYFLTDSGSVFQARPVHVGFGLLYSLGWVTLGFMLWATGSRLARGPTA